ncbi:SIMPL domain-containing protein [Chromohalobacter canadensis]|uniref:SIMPL domain-containing protein n=1 Tax=Chromohalobacter canadensis TaxID=141389 RepID=A0ABZ0Y9H7_9GAMM|nr:SIMPL domain-containing protein [Chromohalobacter canadensis]MCK0768292.1 SIMPL domain-containing protein [Chromohalobacter canadensis]WQH08727.1 SIMPL domain-containing protein [Chromohalobacter canadensis]
MMRKDIRLPFMATALLGALLVAVPQAQAKPGPKTSHELHVQAQSSLDVAPDMARLNARLWERTPAVARSEEASDTQALGDAREQLESRTGELVRALEDAGVESRDIQAGSLNVRPEIISRSRQDDDAEDQVRTQVERPVSVTIRDLERLPRILDALTAAGVDALDGVEYDLKDRDAATDKALSKALERARHKAQLMADTLEVKLGDVINVEETQSPTYTPRTMMMRAESADAKSTTEYRAGEIAIDAGVNVTWEIAD